MENSLSKLENFLVADKLLLSTIICYLTIAAMFANMTTAKSQVIGAVAAAVYFLVNSVFLGRAFFADENSLLRLTLGALLLVMFIGLVGWIVVVVYVLNVVTVILVLAIVAVICSVLRKTVGTRK
jgi:hypothetical protein